MTFIKNRLGLLFRSTKGLILVAMAMIAVETAIFGMLSGPMAEMGVRDIVVRTSQNGHRPGGTRRPHRHPVPFHRHGSHCHRNLHGHQPA